MVNGRPRALISYLEDFLFPADRVQAPISTLSGGERNRLLLARLFTRPTNLLVMDEPTNDLDIETLEILEDMLLDFNGTLLLVSHDRAFLNNLVTSTIALDGKGYAKEYVGGYDDWLRQSQDEAAAENEGKTTRAPASMPVASPPAGSSVRRLTYKERLAQKARQQELSELPIRIELLEAEQHRLSNSMADPAFYQQTGDKIARTLTRLKEIEVELSQAYQRWEELEEIED